MNRIAPFATTVTLLPLLLLTPARAQDKPQDKPSSCAPAQKNPDRHAQFLKDKEEALKKGPVELLFVGDSITDAWRRPDSAQYKLFLERWGKHNPLNIGISGDKTEHVLWRLEHGEVDGLKPKVVVLMIGTNNLGNKPQSTPGDTAAGVKCVVEKLREKLPDSKILLLAVFPRGKEVNHPFRAQVRSVNDEIAKLDDGGKHVKYLDIGAEFLAADGTLTPEVMPDALHPNENGYRIWADSMGPELEKLMK
jgi:lysophospholipase L1-like esterase